MTHALPPPPTPERNYVSFSRPGVFAGAGGGGGFGIQEAAVDFLPAAPPPAAFAPTADVGPELSKETVAEADANTPRTDFPETWLWDLVTVP